MTVFLFDCASEGLRGEITRWFLEVKPGVFVGKVSRRISDLLWRRFCEDGNSRGGVRIESARNEQGFEMDMHGTPCRRVVEYDGVQLIRREVFATEGYDKEMTELQTVRDDPYES